jgi:hypothetical protein
MYTDLDFEERYESAMPYMGSWSSQPGTSRPGITPPRLRAVDPADTRPVPQMTVADLHLPIEVVRARAEDYAGRARARGTAHSMRLWRQCFEQAIAALAREASHVPVSATCEALFWQHKDNEYWISATFGGPRALPALH